MRTPVRGHQRAVPVLIALLMAGCSDENTGPTDLSPTGDQSDSFFLVQPITLNANMNALFQGRVNRDKAGCIRLQPPDDATVVWPKGFTLAERSTGEWVLDEGGRNVGALGQSFRLGGGEVPQLHEGLGFSPDDAKQIHDRCPGRFWIVGEVLSN